MRKQLLTILTSAEALVGGLSSPTSMAFLDNSNILVLEKEGAVRLVSEDVMQDTSVLQAPVDSKNERGLLGIAVLNNNNATSSSTTSGQSATVFLYFTERGEEELRNRVYKYQWNGQSLVIPTLLLDLPAGPGSKDNGGPVVIGPDNNVYSVIGHVAGDFDLGHETKAQNFKMGPDADGTSGIHRVTLDGNIVGSGILSSTNLLDTYYAYGIRNTFGMDFDPITSKLWISENGVNSNDEINLVEPGFNGGWKHVTGLAPYDFNYNGLETFNGSGKYSDPEFVWNNTVSPTALLFFDSDDFGPGYKNDIFVGDYKFGRIYHFELNSERNALSLNGSLADKEANSDSELQEVIFGEGFGVPTDLEIGPDGMLYISSLRDGAIYRISK